MVDKRHARQSDAPGPEVGIITTTGKTGGTGIFDDIGVAWPGAWTPAVGELNIGMTCLG